MGSFAERVGFLGGVIALPRSMPLRLHLAAHDAKAQEYFP